MAPARDGFWVWMPFAQRSAFCLLAIALGGCLSGQTGSPECVEATSCLCEPLYAPGPLLRVHGESADANGRLVAVVDEVFSLHPTDIQVGERVGGAILRQKSCDLAYQADPLVGAELFVMFSPGNQGGYPNCNAFLACASTTCEGLAEPTLTDCWNTCSSQVEATCEGDRQAALLDGAFGWVIPWGDTLDFGADDGEHRIAATDMAVLESANTCLMRFPAAAPPCQDSNGGPCTISSASPERGNSAAWLGIAALFGVAACARRYRKATSRR
jgi:hypothetical protein